MLQFAIEAEPEAAAVSNLTQLALSYSLRNANLTQLALIYTFSRIELKFFVAAKLLGMQHCQTMSTVKQAVLLTFVDLHKEH